MQQRRGTAQQWTDANPRLAAGEIGLEIDTNKFKIGDDVNFWDDLAYFVNSDGLSGELEGFATEDYVDDAIAAIPLPDLTGYATEDYVDTAIENVVGLAPEDLNTLSELADALGDNPAAITALQSDVSALETGKADLVDGQVPANQLANATVDLSDYATTNSPTFTGLTDFEGIVDFSEAVVVGIDALPDQAGNAGKYLTTDGSIASWQVTSSPTPHPFSMIG
jgi:hypothetical protein